MKVIRCLLALLVICFVFRLSPSPLATESAVPDERDQKVLDALLSHLLTSSKFDMVFFTKGPQEIVLHARTPEKTGLIQSHQMSGDIGTNTIPSEVEQDLRRRNSKNAKPDSFDAVEAYFTNLTFSARIRVADLGEIWEQRSKPRYRALEDAYPGARGWVEAYLPGYSKDGTRAVVRAAAGPSPHGATVTALLEKTGEKWVVKWHQVAQYS